MIIQRREVGMNTINNIINNIRCLNNKDTFTHKTSNYHKFRLWKTLFNVDSKYLPIKAVGKGSYGVVCASINTTTDEKVAIKKISNVFDYTVEESLKTLRELRILRHIRHENVIALKDVMIASTKSTFNDIYLVYELMDTDLHTLIQSHKSLSTEHCKYFMFQLLRGLNYLHSANILHRDLKPENLLVNANLDLKICDFGLSRDYKGSGQGQSMTEYVVTRFYRAPELLVSCNNYGASIDVWSVGCIFAELLGRKLLFPGKDSLDQLRKIINILGTQHDSDLDFIKSRRSLNFIKKLPYTPGISFESLFPEADPLALDLLQRMLVFNPKKRITVAEILQHPYMSSLYDTKLLRPASSPCDLDEVDASIGAEKIRNLMWEEMLFYRHPDQAWKSSSIVRDGLWDKIKSSFSSFIHHEAFVNCKMSSLSRCWPICVDFCSSNHWQVH